MTNIVYSEEEKDNVLKRLNRISGQVNGISNMIINSRDCEDILIQISAVATAIKKVGEELLCLHMKNCMLDDIKNNNNESIDEVIKLWRMIK